MVYVVVCLCGLRDPCMGYRNWDVLIGLEFLTSYSIKRAILPGVWDDVQKLCGRVGVERGVGGLGRFG